MKKAIVSGATISVRTGRAQSHTKLGNFKPGETITVLDSALNQSYAKVIWQVGYAYSAAGKYISWLSSRPAAPAQNAVITASAVNVRRGRALKYSRLGTYRNGEKIIVLDDKLDQDYAKVLFKIGYAYSKKGTYIRFLSDLPDEPKEPNAVVQGSRISVRTGRAESFDKLGNFEIGQNITVLDKKLDQNYAHVVWDNRDGYAYSKKGTYIRFLSDLPDVPKEPNAVVQGSRISVRTGRAESFDKLGNFEIGQNITVLDKKLDQNYAHVVWDNRDGYAYSKKGAYIRFLSDSPQPVPGADGIKNTLDIIASCVGGKYIFGGQGTRITEAYVKSRNKKYPEYFTGGRYEYLLAIGKRCDAKGAWKFPDDYAWDCSGLWWYAAEKSNIYGRAIDTTANTFFNSYCVPISKSQLRAGDGVFYRNSSGRISHMGIVGAGGVVYEAMSGYTGVVKLGSVNVRTAPRIVGSGTRRGSTWNVFGRPKIFM